MRAGGFLPKVLHKKPLYERDTTADHSAIQLRPVSMQGIVSEFQIALVDKPFQQAIRCPGGRPAHASSKLLQCPVHLALLRAVDVVTQLEGASSPPTAATTKRAAELMRRVKGQYS